MPTGQEVEFDQADVHMIAFELAATGTCSSSMQLELPYGVSISVTPIYHVKDIERHVEYFVLVCRDRYFATTNDPKDHYFAVVRCGENEWGILNPSGVAWSPRLEGTTSLQQLLQRGLLEKSGD